MNKFTTLLVGKVTFSCFKQLPLNSTLIFELFAHLSHGEKLLFGVIEGLIFSFDNPLGSHSTNVSEIPPGIVKILKTG